MDPCVYCDEELCTGECALLTPAEVAELFRGKKPVISEVITDDQFAEWRRQLDAADWKGKPQH